jgi:hypothetical protein
MNSVRHSVSHPPTTSKSCQRRSMGPTTMTSLFVPATIAVRFVQVLLPLNVGGSAGRGDYKRFRRATRSNLHLALDLVNVYVSYVALGRHHQLDACGTGMSGDAYVRRPDRQFDSVAFVVLFDVDLFHRPVLGDYLRLNGGVVPGSDINIDIYPGSNENVWLAGNLVILFSLFRLHGNGDDTQQRH